MSGVKFHFRYKSREVYITQLDDQILIIEGTVEKSGFILQFSIITYHLL